MGNGAGGELPSTAASAGGYSWWEEVFVSSDKGRREVHYYLRKADGSSDLAVMGKEKSPRHMTYHVPSQIRFLLASFSPLSSPFSMAKLRSRRQVVDWLDSVVSGGPVAVSVETSFGSFDERDAGVMSLENLKEPQWMKPGHNGRGLSWLGSSWTCKKKLKHFQSFSRYGVKISVNDFVYVLAEGNKRFVAHLKDMYEDFNGNKMVVVRWFHKIDEVYIDLPHNFSDREILFSLSHQDLSIECIDGLTTVLNPHHFEKYISEVKEYPVEPFVCHRLYDNDDIKPFDITGVKGYWRQKMLQHLYSSDSQVLWKSDLRDSNSNLKGHGNVYLTQPRKRLRLTRDCTTNLQKVCRKLSIKVSCPSSHDNVKSSSDCKYSVANWTVKDGVSFIKSASYLIVGSQVEILCQDSGLRGCWFRATIIKKNKNKVKVRYQDLKDADDEVNSLEEWVLTSKIAVHDDMGLRGKGRAIIRPSAVPHSGKVSWAVEIGALVDAWWHDGWWEGIVVYKESEDKVQVYFPGEKREAIFSRGEIRHSQEWLVNHWKGLNGRPDVAALIISNQDRDQRQDECGKVSGGEASAFDHVQLEYRLHKTEDLSVPFQSDKATLSNSDSTPVQDLSKDKYLGLLRWGSCRKRCWIGRVVEKPQLNGSANANSGLEKAGFHRNCDTLVALPPLKPLKVDQENCKSVGDSLFSSQVVPPVRSLVMSR